MYFCNGTKAQTIRDICLKPNVYCDRTFFKHNISLLGRYLLLVEKIALKIENIIIANMFTDNSKAKKVGL